MIRFLKVLTILPFIAFAQAQANETLDAHLANAEAGNAEAAFLAAEMLFNGTGVEKDIVKAINLYKQAVEGGHYAAGWPLGKINTSPMVAEINMDYVKELLTFATTDPEGGVHAMEAAFFLAQIHIGEGADNPTIYKWLEIAADYGHAEAAADVGLQYFTGGKLEKDPAKANKYIGMAARRGHAVSQFNYGLVFNQGVGVRKDNVKALTWFIVAANTDAKMDNGSIANFRKGLPPSQVKIAEEEAEKIITRLSR